MNPTSIKLALAARGVTPADIAAALEVSRVSVHYVINNRSKSRRIATAIAQLLDKSVDELWPGQYPSPAEVLARRVRKLATLRAQLSRAMQEAAR